MQHNVTITKEENRVIEEYWCMTARSSVGIAEYDVKTRTSRDIGNEIIPNGRKELDHEPTLEEIAQFLSETKADFVSVEHNYRFVDLQDC